MAEARGDDHIFHRILKEHWPRISHGNGVYLIDADGRRFLDACGGVHVVSIGHGVKEVIDAMHDQARKVSFTYHHFLSEAQIDLAEKISEMTPPGLERVFFVSGGSEATESAIKIARKYHLETGNPGKYKVVTRWQSWHGNTIGRCRYREELRGVWTTYPTCSIFRTFLPRIATAAHWEKPIRNATSAAPRSWNE